MGNKPSSRKVYRVGSGPGPDGPDDPDDPPLVSDDEDSSFFGAA